MRYLRILLILLLATPAFAQRNIFQELQPFRSNYAARTGGSSGYDYGYPACSGCDVESDVTAQWAGGSWGLGSPSDGGDAVDEVASVTLTKQGAPIYGVAGSGNWSNFVGVRLDANGEGFVKASATSQLDWVTTGVTVEWVVGIEASDSVMYVCENGVLNQTSSRWLVYMRSSPTTNVSFLVYADDGTGKSGSWSSVTIPTDGTYQHYRITFNPAGNAELFINDVSQGTISITVLSGKAISASAASLGTRQNATESTLGVFSEFRFSRNLTNNSFED